MTSRPIHRRPSLIDRAEAGIAALVVSWLAWLLAAVLIHAGPLWRDEINTKWMAMRSSPGELWRFMHFDSYPPAWFLVVRAWMASGLGSADTGLRWLGVLVGAGVAGAGCLVARHHGRRPPLLFLSLFALSPTMLNYGTSLRAYGFGVVTVLLMAGGVWRYVDRPGRSRFFWALAAALLSVQTLYYNSATLCALCLAGAAALLLKRDHRALLGLVALGLISATSVLPYFFGPLARAAQWSSLVRRPVAPMEYVERCAKALDAPLAGVAWVWLALALLAAGGCAGVLVRSRSTRRRARAVYLAVAIVAVTLAQACFLLTLGMPTQPWYYITFFAVTAYGLDRGLDLALGQQRAGRVIRLLGVLALVAATGPGTWARAQVRQTNMDRVAQAVAEASRPGDMVLVAPWYLGVSYGYHERAGLPWSSLPSAEDLHVHRFDLLRESLMAPARGEAIALRVRATLERGGRVWFVGDLEMPAEDELVEAIPRWPERGPRVWPYDSLWVKRVGAVFRRQGARVSAIELPSGSGGPVSDYESPALHLIEPAAPALPASPPR